MIMKNVRGDAIFIMAISLLEVTEILVMFGYKFMDDNTVAVEQSTQCQLSKMFNSNDKDHFPTK